MELFKKERMSVCLCGEMYEKRLMMVGKDGSGGWSCNVDKR
jgi:hypothetical protein